MVTNMRKAIIILLMIVMLSVSVHSVSYLSLNLIEEEKSADTNQTVSGIIIMHNSNPDTNLSVTLPQAITLIGDRINITLNVHYNTTSPINLITGNNSLITYNFTLPQDTFSDTYTGALNFTAGGENYSVYTLNLAVSPSPLLSSNNITGDIGTNGSRTFALILTNIGNTDITTSLTKSDIISTVNPSNIISRDNIILSTDTVAVHYRKTANVTVRINVPINTPSGIYIGNIDSGYDSKKAVSQITLNITGLIYSVNMPSTLAIDNAERNSTLTSVFNIRNNGNADLTGLRFISSASEIYNLTFNATGFDLPAGANYTIKLTVLIPNNEPSTNHSIGTFSIFSNEKEFTNTASIYTDVLSRLEIEDLDFFINNDIDGKDVADTHIQDEETISDKARPGSKIKLDFKIKNRFPDDSDIDIRDILITVNLNGIEDGDDAEIESKEFDLEPDESSTRKVLDYTIPLKVETDTYTIEITVEGEDRNGVSQTISRTIYLKVDKRSHEIIINSATISPATVQCGGMVTVYYDIWNIGDQDEDDARVDIINDVIGLISSDTNIELENGIEVESTYQKSVTLDIRKDIPSGTYPVYANVYFSGDILNNRKEMSLEVKDCKVPEEDETSPPQTQPPPNEEIQPPIIPPANNEGIFDGVPEGSEEEPIVTEEKPLLIQPLYLGILLTVNVVAVIAIISLISKYLIKKA